MVVAVERGDEDDWNVAEVFVGLDVFEQFPAVHSASRHRRGSGRARHCRSIEARVRRHHPLP